MVVKPIYEARSDMIFAILTSAKSFPLHLHEYLEMLYVLKGECIMTIGADMRSLSAGDLGIAFPNAIHGYGNGIDDQATGQGIMVICHPGLLGDYVNQLTRYHPADPFIPAQKLHGDVGRSMGAILAQQESESANHGLYRAYTQLILAHVMPALELQRNAADDGGDLTIRLISYISQNYAQPLSLAILSEQLGVSRAHLSRIFSSKLHSGFNDYVNSMRVDAAQNQLLSSGKSILQIALDCGFESQRTFNRVFQKMCGVTPRQFRMQK